MVGVAIGSRLAGYRIDGLLGEGGMGAVYRAWQPELERQVALKVIAGPHARDPSFRERFQREAVAAAAIDHPNIVPVYDAGAADGQLFLAMRLIEGVDLATLIKRETLLEPRSAVAVVGQVAAALDAAHARRLVHRDVKPANVLVTGATAEGHVYLTDFGIARRLGADTHLTSPGSVVGTVEYLAPEIVRGDAVGPAADVYSLGCVLFEALTGEVPFPREHELAVLAAHRDEPPPSLAGRVPAPASLDGVLQRALAKYPAERFPTATAFADAASAAADEPAAAAVRLPSIAGTTTVDARPVQPTPLPAPLAGHAAVGRFVGRARELEVLSTAWAQASAGDLRAVLVAGEPGVGKTRLVAEHARRVLQHPARVLYGRGDEEVSAPFGAFVSVLRRLVDTLDGDVLEAHVSAHGGELTRIVPELGARVSAPTRPRAADPETERFRLREAAVGLFGAAAAREPTLLVLDDIHWADAATLGLLLHLLRGPEAPLLVVATYRDTGLDQRPPLRASLADLVREPRTQRLDLAGLTERDVNALVEATLGDSSGEGTAALSTRIHRETRGNALFATELLRHIAESGGLEVQPTATRGEDLGIPATVRDVVLQRLERVSEAAANALNSATVVGPSFTADLLARVTGRRHDDLLDALDEARQAALVDEHRKEPGRFFFTHAVIQAALADTLGPSRRQRLHRRVAEELEALDGSDAGSLGALARHWLEAGDSERAREAAIRAGEAALAMLAPDEAARWYRQALELHDQRPEPDRAQRAELLIRLGEAERRAGGDTFRAHLLEAGRLARRLGDRDRLARAALANNRGMHSETGLLDVERIELLEAALEMRGDTDDRERALLLATTSNELWSGDHDRRLALSDEALAVARRVGDARVLAEVLYRRAFATSEPATLEERLALTAELVELTDRLGDPLLRLLASIERSRAAIESADLEEALIHAERQQVLAAGCGDAYGRHGAGWAEGWPHALAGRYDEAERAAERALAESLRSEQPDAMAFYGAQLAVIRWDQGRLGELADALVAHIEGPGSLPAHRALAALALLEGGRAGEAGRLIDAAAGDGFALPVDTIWLTGTVLWGEVCALSGHREGAALLLDRLLPWRAQVAFTGLAVHGGVARVAAELAALLDRDDADPLFALAERVHERLRAPALLARTRAGWTTWLAAQGETGRAREQAAHAAEAAGACGCPHLLRGAAEGLTAL
jgi:tetratricopeptide (TPR) repeat protein